MPAPGMLELPRDHLVIDAGGMLTTGHRRVARLPTSLRGLGRLTDQLGARCQVWIHESALAPLGLDERPPGPDVGRSFGEGLFADVGELTTSSWPPRDFSSVHWYRRGGLGFDLHVPAWRPKDPRSPFAGMETGEALAGAVASWAAATGEAPWKGSGSVTSDAWLRPKARPTAVPFPLATGKVRELQMDWWRPSLPSESNMRHLHALDINGAYLAVASSLELPSGEAELVDWPTFDKRVPGLWHIELPERESHLPMPWLRDGGDVWVTTPTMELAIELGATAMEAWLWPDHGRHLRGWQERLRDARAFLIERGEWKGPAGVAIKAVYQMGPGRLASRKRAADPPERDPLYQPYWDLAIIAESRCRLWRRLAKLETPPVAIYRDAVFFLSSRATPRHLGLALGLPVGEGLGQFKPLGSSTAKAARAILERGLADTTRRLNDLVKGR